MTIEHSKPTRETESISRCASNFDAVHIAKFGKNSRSEIRASCSVFYFDADTYEAEEIRLACKR
jgi:hypothetical protein